MDRRAAQWAKAIAEADELAPKMREMYMRTGRLPGFIRRPLQRVLRWYMRSPEMVRQAAREDLEA